MTDVLIQFHALPEELVALLEESVATSSINVAKVLFPPYEALPVRAGELATAVLEPRFNGFVLSIRPILPTRSQAEIDRLHPDAMRVEVGRAVSLGLMESMLRARASDPEVIGAWQKIAKALKKVTRAGVDVSNPTTGACAHYKNHRFSAGAKSLEDAGVPILTLNKLPMKLTGNG
jgi:hypothetical protein